MNRREILRYTAYFAGAAVSAPLASALLMGCEADAVMLEAGFEPAFFNDKEYAFLSKFADTMLPSDGTPGALDVGVPQMIDRMVGEVYSKETQDKNRAGLKLLMDKMNGDNGGDFAGLAADKALAYLQEQDATFKQTKGETTMSGEDVPQEVAVNGGKDPVKSAYFELKSAIIGTFFSTEEVATTMLAYLPVPGEYIPCGDLQELTGGKAWAI